MNNRFSCLLDNKELPDNKEINKLENVSNRKTEKLHYFQENHYNKIHFTKYKNINTNSNNAEKKQKVFTFKEGDFPELIVSSSYKQNTSTATFPCDYMKKVNIKSDDNHDETRENNEVSLEPGWIELKSKKERPFSKNVNENVNENELAEKAINYLINTHTKRTENFIQLNGYDEWEKLFKFPNWEENDAYLEKMYELEDASEESDENENNDVCDYDFDYHEYVDF
jgi:hypothetical protein